MSELSVPWAAHIARMHVSAGQIIAGDLNGQPILNVTKISETTDKTYFFGMWMGCLIV